jgi:hypothetical protein
MISGLVLKYLNGECFVIWRGYETTLLASTEFNLTVPSVVLNSAFEPKHHECCGSYIGAVRRMRTRIGLLAQPEPMRSIIGATQ